MKRPGWCLGVVVSCLMLAGCNWFPSVHFDGGNTGFNAADRTLTRAALNAMTVRYTASLGNLGTVASQIPVTPVYAGGRVFVPVTGRLLSFDAAGVDHCGGTPNTCVPQWSGEFGAQWDSFGGAEVSGNTVYVMASDRNSLGKLFAFDIRGTGACTVSPTKCQPLWTADVLNFDAPTVVGGRVFAFDMHGSLKVFDAAGQQGCVGTPVVCQPLWTVPIGQVETPPTRVAVVNGVAYVADRSGRLTASDANGAQGCSGTPTLCQPIWTAPAVPGSSSSVVPAPVVANGKVFVLRSTGGGLTTSEFAAFDAAGAVNCGGTPKLCQPLWRTPTISATFLTPAAANGKVFVPKVGTGMQAYDAAGSGCSGSPMTCQPLFAFGGAANVVIDNGLIVQVAANGLSAFDANGVSGCNAGVCAPVAHVALGTAFNGFVTSDAKVFGISIDSTGKATLTGAW